MFIRLHHVGLLVNDLNETRKLYCDHFGLTAGREFDLVEEDVRILNIPIGESMIEVNQVINHDSGVGKLPRKRGVTASITSAWSPTTWTPTLRCSNPSAMIWSSPSAPTTTASESGGFTLSRRRAS